jgi:ATP-dependent protease ClpP protease subunit
MTLTLISGAVLFIAGVFFFAYRQGKKIAVLDTLITDNKLHNQARKKIKEINEKTKKKLRDISRDRALKFWLRGRNSKDS